MCARWRWRKGLQLEAQGPVEAMLAAVWRLLRGKKKLPGCAMFTDPAGRQAVLLASKPQFPSSLRTGCPSEFYEHSKDVPLLSYHDWVEFLSQQQ